MQRRLRSDRLVTLMAGAMGWEYIVETEDGQLVRPVSENSVRQYAEDQLTVYTRPARERLEKESEGE